MAQYRCFFLDREHYVLKAEIAECADDESARRWFGGLGIAELKADGSARPGHEIVSVELWRQGRMVARSSASKVAATAAI